MKSPLKIVMLEDNDTDTEIIQRLLKKEIPSCEFSVVMDQEKFLHSLEHFRPDLILADNSLPQFNASKALELVKERFPGIPFIMVTGTMSEEFAANIIKSGADDYILKDRLARLPAAILTSLKQKNAEYEASETQQKLLQNHQELIQVNGQLRELSSHLQNIREEERIQIARDIHDELGQQLTGIKMEVQWLRKNLATEDNSIREKITDIIGRIDETVKSVRRISWSLRPGILDDLGLATALEWHSEEIAKRSEIVITFYSTIHDTSIPAAIATGIFRIYQEVLTNVIRHARASKINSSLLFKDGQLILHIADNGIGMDVKEIGNKKTLGLVGIKERTFVMGGSYELKSEPGKGTEIIITIPVQHPS